MSAVINTQVILQDVRQANIEIIIEAVSYALNLDDLEKNLLHQIFQINMDKLYIVSANDVKNMTDIQLKFVQCELILKIAKKLKMMMMSLEEFISHDAIVEANFQYDEPQQRVWNEVQNFLNQFAASKALDQALWSIKFSN